MIVKESIEFQRGGESPLKSLRVGQTNTLYKKFEEAEVSIPNLIETLQDLSYYTKKTPTGKIYASKYLSDALDKFFDEDFIPNKKDSQYKAHTPEARQFFKKLIFFVKSNDRSISERDFMEFASEFLEKIHHDPKLFAIIIEDLLYTCQMN